MKPGDLLIKTYKTELRPVSFDEFVQSKLFLGEELEPSQLEEARKVLVNGEVWSWDRNINLFVWLWGKGSGKGTLAVAIELYAFYRLILMDNPQKFFRVLPSDEIVFVNLALSGEQSKTNIFNRLSNRLKRSPWFLENFEIIEGGKSISGPGELGTIVINSRSIAYKDKNVVIYSENSEYEHWEGKNIVFFVLDEYSGAKTEPEKEWARNVLNSLLTSNREMPFVGIVMSYMRLDPELDTTALLLERVKKGEIENGYGCVRFPWEMRPHYYQGVFYIYEDVLTGKKYFVPESVYKKMSIDENDVRRKYLCLPGLVGVERGPFFGDTNINLMENIDIGRENAIQYTEVLVPMPNGSYLKQLKLLSVNLPAGFKYVIAIDKGETRADTALTVAHRVDLRLEQEVLPSIVVDAILVWEPNSNLKVSVDTDNVTEVLLTILQHIPKQNLVSIRIDHWNSADMVNKLMKMGYVNVNRKDATLEGYDAMKDKMVNKLFRLPDVEASRKGLMQARYLKTRATGKPKVSIGKQDIVDTFAEVAEELLINYQPVSIARGKSFVKNANIPLANQGMRAQYRELERFLIRQFPGIPTGRAFYPGLGRINKLKERFEK